MAGVTKTLGVSVLDNGVAVVDGSVYKLYIVRGVFAINNLLVPPCVRNATKVFNVFVTVESSYRLAKFGAVRAMLLNIFAIYYPTTDRRSSGDRAFNETRPTVLPSISIFIPENADANLSNFASNFDISTFTLV